MNKIKRNGLDLQWKIPKIFVALETDLRICYMLIDFSLHLINDLWLAMKLFIFVWFHGVELYEAKIYYIKVSPNTSGSQIRRQIKWFRYKW